MRLGTLSKILKDTLAKAAGSDPLPKWIDSFLDPVNQFIEKVGQALQNRLTFGDNFYAKEISLLFVSATEQEVNARAEFAGNSRVYGVLLVASSGETVSTFAWNLKANGNIGVTVTFATVASARCDLILLLR